MAGQLLSTTATESDALRPLEGDAPLGWARERPSVAAGPSADTRPPHQALALVSGVWRGGPASFPQNSARLLVPRRPARPKGRADRPVPRTERAHDTTAARAPPPPP